MEKPDMGWFLDLDSFVRRVVVFGTVVCLLIVLLLTLAWCQARNAARTAKAEGRLAVATGQALDAVTTKTETIRNDQKEQEKEVDEIQGSDQRLPDGYGAELQRLRMRDRDKHRNP